MTTISVCIIAKNEEKHISDCIKSVLPVADEIILLDTGSTDKTIEIAESFDKVKVYQTEWENDFSKARNQCISYAKSDWILCIDADEILQEYAQKNLKTYLENHHLKDKALVVKFLGEDYEPGLISQIYYKAGIFKNHKGIKFILPFHEYPVSPEEDLHIRHSSNCRVYHMQKTDTDTMRERHIRDSKIMMDFLNKSENKKHESYYFRHLGDSYRSVGEDFGAIGFNFCLKF